MIRQMVICTIDHTDGDLHTLIFKFYMWEHLELELKSKLKFELKLSNMYAYITYFTTVVGANIKIFDSLLLHHHLT